jgi:hypothetical protein
MHRETSLSHSSYFVLFQSAIERYPEPAESSRQVHALFCETHCNIILSASRFSKWLLLLRICIKILNTLLVSSVLVTRPSNLALLILVALRVLLDEDVIWCSPLLLSRYGDGLRARRPGLYFRQGQEIFFYFTASRPALGTWGSASAWKWPLNFI